MSADHTRPPQQAAASAPHPPARKPDTAPEHSERVDELLSAALELGPAERAGFLDRACGDRAPLRAEVESLLAAHQRAGPLDVPVGEYAADRFEDAAQQLELALEMDPDWDLGHLFRGQAYTEMGRTEDAIASLRRATELSGRSGITVAALAHAYATSGASEPALELLAELITADEYRPSFEIAKVHLALGDADRAIEWLERAYDQHAHSMAFLMVDPQLGPLHADPRFNRLVTRVGLDANARWQ